MYSKFPFSMENIPRQKGFGCLSLKFGCIISALIMILYSVLYLAQCLAMVTQLLQHLDPDDIEKLATFALMITVTIVHIITLFLTTIMLVGTLREKPNLMRPWVVWTSIQVCAYLMLFILWTTMSMIQHSGGGESLLVYALEFLSLLLRFYMLMLVASYYKQLEEERFDGERLKTLVNSETWYNSA